MTGEGSFAIELILVSLKRSTGRLPDLTQQNDQCREVRVPIGALRDFPIGSIWRKKKQVRALKEYRQIERLFVRDLSKGERGMLGEIVKENCPTMAKEIPVLVFRKKSGDYHYTNFDAIIFPLPSIAKYYFFNSHHSIDHVLAGRVEDEYNSFFDPSKSEIFVDENHLRIATIWLKRDTEDSDAFKAARMMFDKYYLYQARLVGKKRADAMREHRSSFIEASFPIEGKSHIDVRGRFFKEYGATYFFVYSIKKCSSEVPWDKLFFSSDRDNTKSEVNEKTKRVKKTSFTKGSPIPNGNNSVGSDLSTNSYEPLSKYIDDDEEFTFDTRQIERLPKDFQKYKNLTKVFQKPVNPSGLTSNHERGNDSEKSFLTSRNSPSKEEPDSVFENLLEVTNRLQSDHLLGKLSMRYLTPFTSEDKNYEGYSIFPLAQLANNRVILNWCHLKKVHKGKWETPRKIRVVEFCVNFLHFSYAVEVQQRVKDELTLLSIRQLSGHKIPIDVFKTLLFDGAKEKCVWRKLKEKYKENYDFVSVRHTSIDALYSRIRERLK